MGGNENTLTLWLVVLAVSVATFALRFSFLLFFDQVELAPPLRRVLRFVPVAVFTAIVTPQLIALNAQWGLTLNGARLIAALVAVVVAWRTKNVLLTIVAGMTTLQVLQWWL